MWDQAQNHFKETKPVNTLRPRDSFCFLLVSSHFFYPNFKRPIPSQKWILKQQVRVPLNIPKHSTKNHLPMYEPLPSSRQSHSQNEPKTLPGPRPPLVAASTLAPAEISCSTTAWPFSAAQCSAVPPRAPRMRCGRSSSCGCRGETKRIVMGCFSRWLGKILNIGHK